MIKIWIKKLHGVTSLKLEKSRIIWSFVNTKIWRKISLAKNLKVNGIIIAENNSGDSDKMLTMLTPNLGKISCSARRS